MSSEGELRLNTRNLMNFRHRTAVVLQRKYYTDSALRYESMHSREGDANDGLGHSHNVYDSLRRLSRWVDRLILIPQNSQKLASWFHPLLTSSGIPVCALKGV